MILRRNFFIFALCVLLASCSTLQIKVDSHTGRLQRNEAANLLSHDGKKSTAAMHLAAAQVKKLTLETRMRKLIEAARFALQSKEIGIYNAAVGQIVTICQEQNFKNLPGGLILKRRGHALFDPTQAENLHFAEAVRIKGLLARSLQAGYGVPYVAWVGADSPILKGQPGVPKQGMSLPLTAYISFAKKVPTLCFQRSLDDDRAVIGGRERQLAADFSAPIAVLLSHTKNKSIDLEALVFSKRNIRNLGLYQFQPYDPNKIPVVFVHGLLSRPEAWTKAFNGLLADPEIRSRYQFWFYLYPTGLPIWQSAAELRSELDRFHQMLDPDDNNPKLKKIVLVGHSMGGLISNLMIRKGGDLLWQQFSGVHPDQLKISPRARESLVRLLYFSPRKDIDRVIFISTPHRGSELALRPFANLGASFIRLPKLFLKHDQTRLLEAVRDDMRSLFIAPVNSVRFLRADSPLLLSILKLPLKKNTPYHTIIGDRGRGDSPNSTDGVVSYRSSHLEGTRSEKIVPSGHGANENPEGIEEIRRILLEK
ncbi:MAG: esterase/lipase family protein [Chthoniobacterales bacterium]